MPAKWPTSQKSSSSAGMQCQRRHPSCSKLTLKARLRLDLFRIAKIFLFLGDDSAIFAAKFARFRLSNWLVFRARHRRFLAADGMPYYNTVTSADDHLCTH